MKKDFEERYTKGEASFHELDGSKLLDYGHKSINLYLWTIAIRKDYRTKPIPDPQNPNETTRVVRLLHEGLIDALVDLKRQGCTVEYVYGEGVSDKGVGVVQRFCGKDSLIHADKENAFYMYGSEFNPECEAFKHCKNVDKIINAYGKEKPRVVSSENCEELYDSSNLKNLQKTSLTRR